MTQWRRRVFCVLPVLLAALLGGCQAPTMPAEPVSSPQAPADAAQRTAIALPEAWGGQVRCGAAGCLLGAVEHEESTVVLHRLANRTAQLLDRQKVAYHPDSAVWLADDLLAAAVETTASIDVFRLVGDKLTRIVQLPVGFGPRDVVLVDAQPGHYRLLATPYSGKEVAWIDWQVGPDTVKVDKSQWCEAPWHPVRVSRLPKMAGGGIAVACLDGKQVLAVSDADLLAPPKVLATFTAVARQSRPSPSGQWLYVALETGGRNARINMTSGELQWIAAPPTGAVSVAPLADDLVAWGDDSLLTLQRLDAQGAVLETRGLRTSGFSTSLQLLDVDGDGQLDVVVLNSSGKRSDVIYGPLWERAMPRP